MLQSKKNKSAALWLVVKLLLTLSALWFIYRKILNHESTGDYLAQLLTAVRQPHSAFLFFIVLILMILNWSLEALKWRFMINKIDLISFGRSLEAVFSGLTISFFTPNRIGEYAGRVFHLKEGKRMQATFITVIENGSQLLITILAGSVASMIYANEYMDLGTWKMFLLCFLLSGFCVFSLLLYFNLYLFEKLFLRLKMSDYWQQIFHVFALYSGRELLKVMTLSFIRYLIFSLQFYILLRIYGCPFLFIESLLMITMTFFVMSVIPTFSLTEIAVRGAVSAYFFGKLTIDILPVLNATFSLWLINLAIPALLGAVFIFNFRLEKNSQ